MSKGANLAWAARHLSSCLVPQFIEVSVGQWKTDPTLCMLRIQAAFERTPGLVAVRSSALDEDTPLLTNAGRYRSVLDVSIRDSVAFSAAMDAVVASMVTDDFGSDGHAVIVQMMVTDVIASGAATNRDPDTGAPYLMITYETDGDTSAITSGRTAPSLAALRHGASSGLLPSVLRNLPLVLDEITRLRRVSYALEVEFAIRDDVMVSLLQVRDLPFAASPAARKPNSAFRVACTAVRRRMIGEPTCLSDMADWNPAEMIGRAPRQLAYSLYRSLITRTTWRSSRAAFGYYNPPKQELMYKIGSSPYIDIRASLSSLTPAAIPPEVRSAMLDADVNRVIEDQGIHSSIEFDASVSCVGVGTSRLLSDRYAECLPPSQIAEIYRQLVSITMKAVSGSGMAGLASIDARLRQLHTDIDLRMRSVRQQFQWFRSAAWKSIGKPAALTFAMAARHAFIGESMLRSLLANDIVSVGDVDRLRRSVHTVAYSFMEDIQRLRNGALNEHDFQAKYGHLRPGTYDIRSQPYSHYTFADANLELAIDSGEGDVIDGTLRERTLMMALGAIDLDIAPELLARYISSSIQLRELGKFIYSRFISLALEDVAEWGRERGLTRDDLSYFSIQDIRAMHARRLGKAVAQRRLRKSRAEHEERLLIKTPSVLWREDQLLLVTANAVQVSFIGRSHVRGKVVIVGDLTPPTQAVKGRIACVERADPGYDWLLAAGIVGIVTRYGGPNAHLAVRCAELSIPAAIGCGQALFNRLISGDWIEMDCASKTVRTVRPG